MKSSFLLLIALVLALLAAAIAPVFKSDPGMVQVHFRGWTVETSVLILVLAVLALWLLVWVFIRLWKMPAETARRIREQRSLAQLEKGLLALTEGIGARPSGLWKNPPVHTAAPPPVTWRPPRRRMARTPGIAPSGTSSRRTPGTANRNSWWT